MSGWYEQSARSIALDLLRGGKAELVGNKSLRGISPRYMEMDGQPVSIPQPERREATGVRTTLPDGFVSLYLASRYETAREWLRRAEGIVEEAHDVS